MTYGPVNGEMTRGEFVKAVIEALGVPVGAGQSVQFKDVPDSLKPYIEKAVELKLIKGKTPTQFAPNEKLTRTHAFIIAARGMQDDKSYSENILNQFKDSNEIGKEVPAGATPIDFAYKVHTDIGNQMVGALVNDNIVPLTQELKTNDIVKIKTSKKATPRREWINIVKTTQAKNKIKNYFNKIEKNEFLKKGEEILKDELRRRKISTIDFLTEENIEKILNTYKLKDLDDLYINIGSSKLLIGSIINIIVKKEISKEELVLDKIQNRETKIENIKSDIIVEEIDNIKINVASCCDPIPGDKIIGYITKGNGISIHRDNCPNIKDTEERIINVCWNEQTTKKYPVDLLITTNNNKNILLDIISKTTNNNITVNSVNTLNENTRYKINISVENKANLEKFISDLKNIQNIINIERPRNRKN